MSERRKSKEKMSGSGATAKGKWPYYNIMNFLEYYLQRRNTTGNVPQTEAAAVSFTDPEDTAICDSELDGESTYMSRSEYYNPPSSTVGLHVLISGNLSVLSGG
jgi:hypothetical protein